MGAVFRWVKLLFQGHKALGQRVARAGATLPQTTTGDLFNVTGKIILTSIIGVVTKVLGTEEAATAVLGYCPTGGSFRDINKGSGSDLQGKALGSWFTITGTRTSSMTFSDQGVGYAPMDSHRLLIAGPGKIQLTMGGSITGEVQWIVHYLPVDPTSVVTAA